MGENNDISLLAWCSSVLGRTNAKKKTFHNISDNLFSTNITYDWFSNHLFLYAPVYILCYTPLFPQLPTYIMDWIFPNQKTNKNILISHSLKYKHLKKNYLRKNKWRVGWNKHSGEQYYSKIKY